MTTSNSLIFSALLTILACTNASQYGAAPEPGPTSGKKPAKMTEKAATDQQNTDGGQSGVNGPQDGSTATPPDLDKDPADTKQAVSPAPTPPPTPPSTNTDPNVVEFTIPPGTGRRAWNSPSSPIRVRQGQTLVIKNADSQAHWVHTNFTPFPHPFQGIAPGASARYRINGTSAAGMHDHLTNAPIYMTISR